MQQLSAPESGAGPSGDQVPPGPAAGAWMAVLRGVAERTSGAGALGICNTRPLRCGTCKVFGRNGGAMDRTLGAAGDAA